MFIKVSSSTLFGTFYHTLPSRLLELSFALYLVFYLVPYALTHYCT